jgi:hypothetical protein
MVYSDDGDEYYDDDGLAATSLTATGQDPEAGTFRWPVGPSGKVASMTNKHRLLSTASLPLSQLREQAAQGRLPGWEDGISTSDVWGLPVLRDEDGMWMTLTKVSCVVCLGQFCRVVVLNQPALNL